MKAARFSRAAVIVSAFCECAQLDMEWRFDLACHFEGFVHFWFFPGVSNPIEIRTWKVAGWSMRK